MAQRLVRTLCPHCKEPYQPGRDELPKDFPYEEGVTLYRQVGCRQCRQVGYMGRLGIFELLVSSEAIRKLAHDRASTWEIAQQATKEGMLTLRQDGWRKVLAGRTTLEEVARATRAGIGR